MNADERLTLIDTLGIGWRVHGTTRRLPWRNRTAHNLGNPETSATHEALAASGLLVRVPAQDYGRMRVFRITSAGAAALGLKLPKKLAALIPAAEDRPPTFDEAMKLAA